jgi:hypothetical protein
VPIQLRPLAMCLETGFGEDFGFEGVDLTPDEIVERAASAARHVLKDSCEWSFDDLNYLTAQVAERLLNDIFERLAAHTARDQADRANVPGGAEAFMKFRKMELKAVSDPHEDCITAQSEMDSSELSRS